MQENPWENVVHLLISHHNAPIYLYPNMIIMHILLRYYHLLMDFIVAKRLTIEPTWKCVLISYKFYVCNINTYFWSPFLLFLFMINEIAKNKIRKIWHHKIVLKPVKNDITRVSDFVSWAADFLAEDFWCPHQLIWREIMYILTCCPLASTVCYLIYIYPLLHNPKSINIPLKNNSESINIPT